MTADSHSRAPPGPRRVPHFRGEPRAPRTAAPSYRTFTRFPKGEMS
jgi:hypothetical protein